MGIILLVLYVIASAALVIGLYTYVSLKEVIKANKFNSTNSRRVEVKINNLEKIINNKKWTWK